MIRFFKFISKSISMISPKLHTHILYYIVFKKRLKLSKSSMQTLNEKIHWLKFNEYLGNDIYTKCADKYLVREYVISKGCGSILNPLIGVYNNFEEIRFSELPSKFALKCNHGAGYNIIVEDKDKLDISVARKKVNEWMRRDFSLSLSELHYKDIPRKIICEEFLSNEDGRFPDDYKFYCFNGVPECVMLCQGRGDGQTKFYYFDLNWNLLPLSQDSKDALKQQLEIPKPKGFEEMLSYAKTLSKEFKFVRADFYLVEDRVVFGELTFTPSGGLDASRLNETDIYLGNKLILE